MAQAYRIINKPHRRVTQVAQFAIALDGTRIEIKQNGPLTTYPVGAILTDVQPHELAAFPDRFAPASAAEVALEAHMAEEATEMAAAEAKAQTEYEEKLAVVQAEHARALLALQTEHATQMAAVEADKQAKVAEAEAKMAQHLAATTEKEKPADSAEEGHGRGQRHTSPSSR